MILFQNRGMMPRAGEAAELFDGALSAEAFEDARAAAPGWDVYGLEQEWRLWCGKEEIEPRSPNRHFIRFCQSWYEKRGAP